jgi:GAF domain-containing protein
MSIEQIHPPAELTGLFIEAAQTLPRQGGVNETLRAICELAVKVVHADYASITTAERDSFATVAHTSPVAARADQLQYRTNQGPCLDAVRKRETARSDDLLTDPRWPAVGTAVAREHGIRSMLSRVLPVDDGFVGAINLFSRRPAAFTDDHEHLAVIFAAQAAIAVRAASEHERAENLSHAVHSNRRIGMAVGIVMATDRVDEEEAFRRIAKVSQNTNRKVADVAEAVVRAGVLSS